MKRSMRGTVLTTAFSFARQGWISEISLMSSYTIHIKIQDVTYQLCTHAVARDMLVSDRHKDRVFALAVPNPAKLHNNNLQ